MAFCIQTSQLTKCYGNTVAVGGLSLQVVPGEVFGLLGPNGAGKSTTLHMLCGLTRPSSGTVNIFGRNIKTHFLDIAPRMGVLVERPSFYEHLSARRNLALFARVAGREVTVDRALDMVGILDMASRKAGQLSMGERQRLGLAQALLLEPELLILDEPASGLDVEAAHELFMLLRRLADEAGVTVVLSSHMMQEVEAACDRVAVINRGRLVSCERTESFLSYDVRHVDVIVDGVQAAARRLSEQPWVESAEVKAGKVRVLLKGEDAHHLMTFLAQAGFRISAVIPRRRTLLEYFLKVLNP